MEYDADAEGKEGVPTSISWSAVTDVGRFRKNNEDAFLALEMDPREVRRLGKYGTETLSDCDLIFAVSDGMGGHNAGEFASRIAVEKITEQLPNAFRLDVQGLKRGAPDLLEQVFQEIHEEIKKLAEAYEEVAGMGATLSLCWLDSSWLHFCHIGDSRIYYLPEKGGIKQLSEDHTHVARLVKSGQISAMEAKFHPARNQLSQALTAMRGSIDPQLGAVGHEPGDRFVICSDGLTEGLSDNGIERIIRERPEKFEGMSDAESIVRESIENSGKDNTTAVVVTVRGEQRA